MTPSLEKLPHNNHPHLCLSKHAAIFEQNFHADKTFPLQLSIFKILNYSRRKSLIFMSWWRLSSQNIPLKRMNAGHQYWWPWPHLLFVSCSLWEGHLIFLHISLIIQIHLVRRPSNFSSHIVDHPNARCEKAIWFFFTYRWSSKCSLGEGHLIFLHISLIIQMLPVRRSLRIEISKTWTIALHG